MLQSHSSAYGASSGVDLDLIAAGRKRTTVLIVDDDFDMVTLLKHTLMEAGMDVVGANSGLDAIEHCPRIQPDVILLDLVMPEMDGYETLGYLRNITNCPIIFVTCKAQKDEVVRGLLAGSDDYLTKPVYPPELIARIQSVMRRSRFVPPVTTYAFPSLKLIIDLDTREVTLGNGKVQLTNKEFEILTVLAKYAPKPVSKDILAREVWGENDELIYNRIKYIVHLLRQKMEKYPSMPQIIQNREGVGYYLAIDHKSDKESVHSIPKEIMNHFYD